MFCFFRPRPYQSDIATTRELFNKNYRKEFIEPIIAADDDYFTYLNRIMERPMKCNGVHCKCMSLGGQCPNRHYATCPEHNPAAGLPQLADNPTKPPMRSTEITKDNLRVGDVIQSAWRNNKAKVLEVLDHSFAVSNFGAKDDDWRYGFNWIRFSEAKENNYTIVLPPEEQAFRKVTMAELEEQFGGPVEIIEEI